MPGKKKITVKKALTSVEIDKISYNRIECIWFQAKNELYNGFWVIWPHFSRDGVSFSESSVTLERFLAQICNKVDDTVQVIFSA